MMAPLEQLPGLPVMLPLFVGALLVLCYRQPIALQRTLSLISMLLMAGIAGWLATTADSGRITIYQLGNWPSYAGIVLQVDRLAALMLLITALLGVVVSLYAGAGSDRRTPHFHALLQFQLMGLNGAFLTGDLFDLFVFFEVLLIASYGLLLHGLGTERLKRAVHYVSFNLIGSGLFLIGVAWLYGLLGTLNMADLAAKIAVAPADDLPLIRAAVLLVLMVFAIKGALLPLYFWLPATYSAASAPVAALFAVMTKVGFYSLVRVSSLLLGSGVMAGFASELLLALGLLTLFLAAFGALAASTLRRLVAYLLVISAGTLFLLVGQHSAAALGAALFYAVHSTFAAALLFLIVEAVSQRRARHGDSLREIDVPYQRLQLGTMFMVAAVIIAALPPFTGFFAKIFMLRAIPPDAGWVSWTVILFGSFLVILALARAGTHTFWQQPANPVEPRWQDGQPPRWQLRELLAIGLLAFLLVLLSLRAEALLGYASRAGEQLMRPQLYIDAALNKQPVQREVK